MPDARLFELNLFAMNKPLSSHESCVLQCMAVYKVIFHNNSQVYELYAKAIYQSDMYGFVEVEELVFGERSQILVTPGEEKLKAEFSGVKRSFIPMHAIIRIDEVNKEGVGKVTDAPEGSNVSQFPAMSGRPIPKPDQD